MNPNTQEAAMLESILPQLEAEGFEVFAEPSAHILPPFLRGYRPDAIAVRSDRKLAIEIVRQGSDAQEKLLKIRALLAGQKGWELRVYWVNPLNGTRKVEGADREAIAGTIHAIESLLRDDNAAPALLLAWATLEAIGRALLPDLFVRPQTPARLIEVLASQGHLTPSEADRFRELADVRNKIAHGDLQTGVRVDELRSLVSTLKELLKLVPTS